MEATGRNSVEPYLKLIPAWFIEMGESERIQKIYAKNLEVYKKFTQKISK